MDHKEYRLAFFNEHTGEICFHEDQVDRSTLGIVTKDGKAIEIPLKNISEMMIHNNRKVFKSGVMILPWAKDVDF